MVMTRAVGVRPGTVTAAQVIIRILATLGAVGAGLTLVFGVIGLMSGASVAASAFRGRRCPASPARSPG
jgi:hypothetical protein